MTIDAVRKYANYVYKYALYGTIKQGVVPMTAKRYCHAPGRFTHFRWWPYDRADPSGLHFYHFLLVFYSYHNFKMYRV